MANTFTLISTVTVGAGGAASIDFTSIPNGGLYTDLQLIVSGRSSRSSVSDNVRIKINGTTSGYSGRGMEGDGASAASYTDSNQPIVYMFSTTGANATANTFSNGSIYFPNYASSTNKSFSADSVSENNGTTSYQRLGAGLWSNTSAITSLSIYPDVGTWVQYSTASLYGILKGSGGATVS